MMRFRTACALGALAAAGLLAPAAWADPDGAALYTKHCASCHGADGAGVAGKARGSIVDGSYLALVSDQGLRTTVIAGRSDLGMPDFRGGAGATPLSAAQVADVVAFLAAKRPEFPGRPYPESK